MILRALFGTLATLIPISVGAIPSDPVLTNKQIFECGFLKGTKTIPAPAIRHEKYSEEMGGDQREWTYYTDDQQVFGSPVSSLSFLRSKDSESDVTSYYIASVMMKDNLDDVRFAVEKTGQFRCSLHLAVAREYTCLSTQDDDRRSIMIAPATGRNNPGEKTAGTVFVCRFDVVA